MKKKAKGMIFMGMGFELVGIVVASLYLGQWFDKTMEWNGIGLALILFAALGAWLIHLIILINKFQKEEQLQKDSQIDS